MRILCFYVSQTKNLNVWMFSGNQILGFSVWQNIQTFQLFSIDYHGWKRGAVWCRAKSYTFGFVIMKREIWAINYVPNLTGSGSVLQFSLYFTLNFKKLIPKILPKMTWIFDFFMTPGARLFGQIETQWFFSEYFLQMKMGLKSLSSEFLDVGPIAILFFEFQTDGCFLL